MRDVILSFTFLFQKKHNQTYFFLSANGSFQAKGIPFENFFLWK